MTMQSSISASLSGERSFDFLFGNWRVRHRRLSRRMAGDTNWVEFDGSCRVEPILGGLGNFDQNIIELPEGRYEACSVRLFNSATRLWSIHWIDGRTMKMDVPMLGCFSGGVGTFFGDDTFDGRPVRVRFLWSAITEASAHWEQAFTDNGGRSWETNWYMNFSRA